MQHSLGPSGHCLFQKKCLKIILIFASFFTVIRCTAKVIKNAFFYMEGGKQYKNWSVNLLSLFPTTKTHLTNSKQRDTAISSLQSGNHSESCGYSITNCVTVALERLVACCSFGRSRWLGRAWQRAARISVRRGGSGGRAWEEQRHGGWSIRRATAKGMRARTKRRRPSREQARQRS
jgi:hypothetical protein